MPRPRRRQRRRRCGLKVTRQRHSGRDGTGDGFVHVAPIQLMLQLIVQLLTPGLAPRLVVHNARQRIVGAAIHDPSDQHSHHQVSQTCACLTGDVNLVAF